MAKTILLADDSLTIQKVIELTFLDGDYEIISVSNGDEALAKLPQVRPDFLIADVHMPGVNGYQLARESKSLAPAVPVLLLVGTFEPFDEKEFKSCGADAFLKKPFDSQELLRQVERLGGGEARTAAPPPAAASAAELAGGDSGEADDEPDWQAVEVEADLDLEDVELEPVEVTPEGEVEDAASLFEVEASPEAEAEAPEIQTGEELEDEVPDIWPIEASAPEAPEVWPVEEPEPPPAVEPRAVEPRAVEPRAAEPRAAEPAPPPAAPAASGAAPDQPAGALSDEDVERIARRMVDMLGDRVIREVAWEVIPDLAEVVIKDRLRELESQVE